jgi:heptosyltransferase-3
MRILVIRAGGLGDVLLTLPAIAALRARYPQSRVVVAGYPSIWQVAGPLVDEIISIDEPRFAGLLTGTLSEQLRSFLQGFDLVVRYSVERERSDWADRTAAREWRLANPYPPPGVHAAEWLVQALDLPMPPALEMDGLLGLAEEERDDARRQLHSMGLHGPTFIHPGAGAAWKRWPAGRFARVAAEISRLGHPVTLIEGPADADAVASVLAAASFPVIREPAPRRLAAMLSWGRLYVGNDSGITHLAALVGVPVVALFGPTDPANWAPLGRSIVLRTCTHRSERPGQIRVCDDALCLAGISVESVLDAAGRLLSNA